MPRKQSQLSKIAIVCCLLLALYFSQAPAQSIANEPISDPVLQLTKTPAPQDFDFPSSSSKEIVHERHELGEEVETVLINRGDILIQTKSSPTGLFIVKPGEKQRVIAGEKRHLKLPSWNQRFSKSGLLLFQAVDRDILATPIDGNGGPGTAARGDNQWRFSGPLAVGGFGLYGAAVQVNEEENRILIYEAYERSHHQARIHLSRSPITWLGWAGENGEHLYFLQKDDGKEHLYRFEPTFPDPTPANRGCFYSNKPLTDCMMQAIRELRRKVSPVVGYVDGIWVSLGEQPQQPAGESQNGS
jgi:hypothetical protein